MTKRQMEVCRRWVIGNVPKKVIAAEMGLSIKTVDKHVQNVMDRIGRNGTHNQLGMLVWMVRNGYVRLWEVFPGTWAEV